MASTYSVGSISVTFVSLSPFLGAVGFRGMSGDLTTRFVSPATCVVLMLPSMTAHIVFVKPFDRVLTPQVSDRIVFRIGGSHALFHRPRRPGRMLDGAGFDGFAAGRQ